MCRLLVLSDCAMMWARVHSKHARPSLGRGVDSQRDDTLSGAERPRLDSRSLPEWRVTQSVNAETRSTSNCVQPSHTSAPCSYRRHDATVGLQTRSFQSEFYWNSNVCFRVPDRIFCASMARVARFVAGLPSQVSGYTYDRGS
ncbi:hypothetical protein BaRGS_00007372, partial [Batillaria attramentaria]